MSTYQPPSGQPPEGTPGYAEPQDPWASGGYDSGLASVPTDPIPQPYEQYAAYSPGDVWSQETVAAGGPDRPVPQRSRAPMIAVVVVVAVILGGGFGFGAWYFITNRNRGGDQANQTASPSAPTTAATIAAQAQFDPHGVREGDCLANKGTPEVPDMEVVQCSTAGSYRVVKIATGADIPENDAGRFDATTTSVAVCQGTNYQTWYGYQDIETDEKDVFFCMTNN